MANPRAANIILDLNRGFFCGLLIVVFAMFAANQVSKWEEVSGKYFLKILKHEIRVETNVELWKTALFISSSLLI